MTRKLLVGAVAAGAFAITAGTAVALTGGGDATPTPNTGAVAVTTASDTSSGPTQTSGAPATELTADDARRIVQARYGGTVTEVERELEHGRMEWDVEIDAADGHHYEVRLDSQSGAVTRVEQDDDHDRDGDDRDDDRDDDRHDDDRDSDDD